MEKEKNNFLILTDTRQQKEKHIIKAFDKQGIKHIQTKLDSADYMALRFKDNQFVFDFSTLIDTKKDLLEMAGNLCHTTEHARLVREVERGQSLGCKKFIFLIGEKNIKSMDDIKKWSNPNTKIEGETLLKVMLTFQKHHNCTFLIIARDKMGQAIIDLLS